MTFRIVVQVWCEVDPTLNVRVDRQTGLPLVENGDVLTRVSPLGRFGVASALELACRGRGDEPHASSVFVPPDVGSDNRVGGAEVVAYALGDGHESALRHALAAGVGRAVQIHLPGGDLNPDSIAPLAEWLREQQPDLVIADRSAGRLAAHLNWAHLAGLDHLQIADGQLWAIRQLGRGNCERVTAKLPAAVRLQTDSPRWRYVSQARIIHATDRAIEQISLTAPPAARKAADLGPLQPCRPRTRLGATPAADAPASGLDRLSALMGVGKAATAATANATEPGEKTPDQMAEEFVRYLAHHDLLND